jgi:hypothetical protein
LPAQGIQGRSMTALVAGQAGDWKNRAFAERNSSMIRTPQFKYIKNARANDRHGGGNPELYDLTKDPLEMNNLAGNPAYAAIVKDLAGQLDQWQQDSPAVPLMAGVALPPKADAADGAPKAGKKAGRANQNQK